MTASVTFTVPGEPKDKLGRKIVPRGQYKNKGVPKPRRQKVSDRELLDAYLRLKNVHHVGRLLGIHGGSAHERLAKMGAIKRRVLDDGVRTVIRAYYEQTPPEQFSLPALCKAVGFPKTSVCRVAAEMGLTDLRRPPNANTHRGLVARNLANNRPYRQVKRGKRLDLGDIGFRSSWEANYARYLNFLQRCGDIERWEFEPETFWFEKIRRGIRSYTPDFKVFRPDGSSYFVEVKGWLDDASLTKLKRMRIYHPEVDLHLVTAREYRALAKQFSGLPGWEGPRPRGSITVSEILP